MNFKDYLRKIDEINRIIDDAGLNGNDSVEIGLCVNGEMLDIDTIKLYVDVDGDPFGNETNIIIYAEEEDE